MYTYFLIFYVAMKFSENNYSNIDWCFYFKQAVDVPQTVPGGGKIGANLCGTQLPFPSHSGLWDWVVKCCQCCSPRGQGKLFFLWKHHEARSPSFRLCSQTGAGSSLPAPQGSEEWVQPHRWPSGRQYCSKFTSFLFRNPNWLSSVNINLIFLVNL